MVSGWRQDQGVGGDARVGSTSLLLTGISFSLALDMSRRGDHPHLASAFQESLPLSAAHGVQEHVWAARLGLLPANLPQTQEPKCLGPQWKRGAGADSFKRRLGLGQCLFHHSFILPAYGKLLADGRWHQLQPGMWQGL